MAELMVVLTDEDIVPRRFPTTFTGLINKAKIVAATASQQPFTRNVSFVVQTTAKAWFVLYDKDADEYWFEELVKAM